MGRSTIHHADNKTNSALQSLLRRVDSTWEWPGEKSHSELALWFDNDFEKNQIEFPGVEQTTQFHRSGVTGDEYLGMPKISSFGSSPICINSLAILKYVI
jgi:hypothetical protein